MRSFPDFFRRLALVSLLCAQLGCGETSRDEGALGGGGATPAMTSDGASASHAAASAISNGGGGAAAAGRAVDRVDIGDCQFEDPNRIGAEMLATEQFC